MEKLTAFNPEQIETVTQSTAMAEELVSDYFKMSTTQWLRSIYDIKTLADLEPKEIIRGPYAQIIRYEGKRKDKSLGSAAFDFYKICIQDHAVLYTLDQTPQIRLFPFSLYIVTHELIHIVRFKKFLQNFIASEPEMQAEEKRVHDTTRDILKKLLIEGLQEVLAFYQKWRMPIEDIRNQ